MSDFKVISVGVPGASDEEESVKTWYVMEGEFEQYRCSSPKEADLLLDGLEKAKASESARKVRLKEAVLFESSEGILVATKGNIAKKCLIEKGYLKSDQKMLPEYVAAPPASEPSSLSALKDESNQAIDKSRKGLCKPEKP